MWINQPKTATAIVGAALVLNTASALAHQTPAAAAQESGKPQGEKPIVMPASLHTLREQRVKELLAAAPVSDKMKGLLKELLDAANREAQYTWNLVEAGRASYPVVLPVLKDLLSAELALSFRQPDRAQALKRHVDRLQPIYEWNEGLFKRGVMHPRTVARSRFLWVEAQIMLERAKEGKDPTPETLTPAAQGSSDPQGQKPPLSEPRSQKEEKTKIPSLHTLGEDRVKKLLAAAPVSDKMKGLLKDLVGAANLEAESVWQLIMSGRQAPMGEPQFLNDLLSAELALSFHQKDRVEALKRHVDRLETVHELTEGYFKKGIIPAQEVARSRFLWVEAQIMLERAKADKGP
jgi:hypothetical protein